MIKWHEDFKTSTWASMTGTDKEGNIFHVTANGEVYTCITPDGRKGQGWTAKEALANAQS